MTVIIQTTGFSLEDELQTFIENSLRMLVCARLKVSEIKVILGAGDSKMGKTKFCRLYMMSHGVHYSITQYGNSYEEAVLISVKELELKVHKI